MARMKRTGTVAASKPAAKPVESNLNSSASSSKAQGKGASQAPIAKPVAMNEEPHTEFVPVYIHTAKCDICEKRNDSVLQRCLTCTSQLCYRCMLGGDGIHFKRNDMDWTDYGAQANSIMKAQQKAGEYAARFVPGSPRHQRYTPTAGIPSSRSHHKELKHPRQETMKISVVDEILGMEKPTPKKQKTAATYQQSSLGKQAPAGKKDASAGNPRMNRPETQFPRAIPSHRDDYYGPSSQRYVFNVQDVSDHDMTEEDSSLSSDCSDEISLSDIFYPPHEALRRKCKDTRPNPWAKEIQEHKKDINSELSLIGKHLDLLKDKERLALVRKQGIDEVVDAACILMNMRADPRGFPVELENSVLSGESLAKETEDPEVVAAANILMGMRPGGKGRPAQTEHVSKGMGRQLGYPILPKHKNDGSMGATYALMGFGAGARNSPAHAGHACKQLGNLTLTREYQSFGATAQQLGNPTLARGHQSLGATAQLGRPNLTRGHNGFETATNTSVGIQTDTRPFVTDKKYPLSETQKLAIEKERKIDAVVEAAYYSLMREARSADKK
ncbi:hypothetical protein V490_02593 [Pseudogymnoascus sp. VKM F-3557]|nr:hypothetical protein V490_02593 [Pseudogymnoascus sp. VKM F-3557]